MATDMSQRKATKSTQVGAPPSEPDHLPCPRCHSANTKFCYYNNYNFSQPRHFCKSCRRYWTHGGALRDIPVGGGSRKNAKRCRTTNATSSATTSTGGGATVFASGHNDFRYFPAADHGGAVPFASGSFTSLLNTPGAGLLALGGFGLDDVGYGLGRPVWQFQGVMEGGATSVNGGGGSMSGHTWQLENGDGGFVGGTTGDCFNLTDLAISTPGIFMK